MQIKQRKVKVNLLNRWLHRLLNLWHRLLHRWLWYDVLHSLLNRHLHRWCRRLRPGRCEVLDPGVLLFPGRSHHDVETPP